MNGRHDSPAGWSRVLSRILLAAALALQPMVYASVAKAASPAALNSGSVSIRTPDFDETLRFYQENLGFRLLSTRNLLQGRVALMERERFLLEIAEADHPAPELLGASSEHDVTPVPVINLLVSDVDSEIHRLHAKGVEILQMPEDNLEGTYRTAQIRDNGRHRIELREPLGDPGSFHAVGR